MTHSAILVVEHEDGAPAGWLGEDLEALGCTLDVRRPYDGERLPGPEEVETFAGVVVLGGSVAAWEDEVAPWLPATRALVRAGEATGVPVLGICLGHQVAALALGGQVAVNPAGPTVAVVPVCWSTDAAEDPLLGPVAGTRVAVHWNNDVVATPPPGARVLATSPDGAVQAARLGRHVWGVQFHPEAGPAILERWVREDGPVYAGTGLDLDRYLADARDHTDDLRDGCRRLADGFHRMVTAR